MGGKLLFSPHTPFSAFVALGISPSADGDEGAAKTKREARVWSTCQPFEKGWTENFYSLRAGFKGFSTS